MTTILKSGLKEKCSENYRILESLKEYDFVVIPGMGYLLLNCPQQSYSSSGVILPVAENVCDCMMFRVLRTFQYINAKPLKKARLVVDCCWLQFVK